MEQACDRGVGSPWRTDLGVYGACCSRASLWAWSFAVCFPGWLTTPESCPWMVLEATGPQSVPQGCVPHISLYRQSGLVGARRVQWDNRENAPASRPFITSAKTLFLNQVICSFLRLGSNIFGAGRQPVTVCM